MNLKNSKIETHVTHYSECEQIFKETFLIDSTIDDDEENDNVPYARTDFNLAAHNS